jgi:beta-glucuronidase
MLYPQTNLFRQVVDLSGYWEFCIDPEGIGEQARWFEGGNGRFPNNHPIAVPASWNDQFTDCRDYLGAAWYQTSFDLPWGWSEKRIFIRFGSVNYLADVWLNGKKLGNHEGGHLPFAFDVTALARPEGNRLVVRVDGKLAKDRVPPGLVDDPLDSHQIGNHPATTYDFFPFCGIHRPVFLAAVPESGIADVTVKTNILDGNGRVQAMLEIENWQPGMAVQISMNGHGADVSVMMKDVSATAVTQLTIPNAAFWSPDSPTLYDLTAELLYNNQVIDRYTLPVGIRTIEIAGDKLLLNGQPIVLRGFGRHEDFPITGRGTVPAVNIKDFALLEWIGANSFRTSHYPYDEEMLTLADRLGFLVIAETPAVGLFFQEDGLDRRLQLCRQMTQELISRDKNHPSVIMWSLANEARSVRGNEVPFFRTLYDLAKSLDDSRPITIVSDLFTKETSFEFFDVVCLNIYRGWYQESGDLAAGLVQFERILDESFAKFGKPILVTEFGADAIPGHHALPPEMFSEEYQADFIEGYINIMDDKPFVAGQHVWNMCDFKTAQGVKRPLAMNFKGIFTRDRRPKLAAHRLRNMWHD